MDVERSGEAFELGEQLTVVGRKLAVGDAAPPFPEMVTLFEQWSNELTDVVSRMDDASWNRMAQFYYKGRVVSEQPVGQFLWFILFDAIHHRGQLSTYLRPMGATVPAIYGPSGDHAAS